LRHRSKWMDEISLVVADEVHLLNDSERGPTLEVDLSSERHNKKRRRTSRLA